MLTGMGWQLRDKWEEAAANDDDDEDSSEEEDEGGAGAGKAGDAMEGVEAGKGDGGKADEGGLGDMLGDELDVDEDEDMEGME